MDDLTNRVAVITGGASGMGRAFAQRFAEAGMKVVLADVEAPPLGETVDQLSGSGAKAIGMVCDVSDHAAVLELKTRTEEAFGPAQVVCLNAGVGAGGTLAETTLSDWKWVVDVNLWGVVHGVDVFLPGLRERDEGHIVFTASVAGHYSFPRLGPYATTKYGVVAIAETLHAELREEDSAIGVTCLCPGLVSTNIFDSERNRPEILTNPTPNPPPEEELVMREAFLEWVRANALSPSEVAEMVHRSVLNRTFWLFTDEEHLPTIAARHAAIVREEEPPPYQPLLDL